MGYEKEEKMRKVTVLSNGITALDEWGKTYEINMLVIVKDNNVRVPYGTDSHFFKVACPPNTKHSYEVLSTGQINLF